MTRHYPIRTLVTMFMMFGLVGLGLMGQREVHAQGRWILTPSLGVAEQFTDNVFLTATDRKSDFITQFTPSLVLTHERSALTISAGYSITGELYADNSDLNNIGDNQSGFLSASYQATEQLTLSVSGYYARTNNAQTFLRPPAVPQGVVVTPLPTVVEPRRVVNQATLDVLGTYQLDVKTALTGGYSFSATDDDSTGHTGRFGLTRQLSALDQGALTGSASLFETGNDTTTSYAVLFGWARQWTPDLTTSVALGPEVTDDEWHVAANLALGYRVRRELTVSLAFTQGTSLVVGAVEPQIASTLTGTVSYQPFQALGLTAFGSVGRVAPFNDISSSDATTSYAVGVSASYQVTAWMVAYLRYEFTLQEEVSGGSIRENLVTLGLTFSYPVLF